MNPTEELLPEILHRHVNDAPLVLGYQPTKRRDRMSRAKWVAPLAVVGITAVVVLCIAWMDRQASTGDSASAAVQDDASDLVPDIRGLTGEAVGVALGLRPMKTADQPGCQTFAEFVNGEGFCFEQLTWPDRSASYILGRQINGHAPSDLEAAYLAAVLELDAMNDGTITYDVDEKAALAALIDELGSQLPPPAGTPAD